MVWLKPVWYTSPRRMPIEPKKSPKPARTTVRNPSCRPAYSWHQVVEIAGVESARLAVHTGERDAPAEIKARGGTLRNAGGNGSVVGLYIALDGQP